MEALHTLHISTRFSDFTQNTHLSKQHNDNIGKRNTVLLLRYNQKA